MLAVLGVAAARFEAVELSLLLMPMLLSGLLLDALFTLARRLLAGERVTQPHRGHLYQIAHRSGMDPRVVAATHWGFAAFGGVVALGFFAVPSQAKPLLPILVLLPQLGWLAYVVTRARRAGLGAW